MRILLLASLLLLMAGCQVQIDHTKVDIPEEIREVSGAICDKTYILHRYDCSNRSFDLMYSLCMMGYDARIYAYSLPGPYGHAIVEVVLRGRTVYLDPTRPEGREVVSRPSARPRAMWVPEQIMGITNKQQIQVWIWDYLGHLKEEEVNE